MNIKKSTYWSFLYLFLGFVFISTQAVLPAIFAEAAPPGFEIETVAGGLSLPTALAYAPDGRLFIAEKSGAVKIFKNGELLPTPFLQLTDLNDYADHGLLGIALDPDFETNGYVYLSYTYENDPSNYEGPKTGRIVRVTAIGDLADESTSTVLIGSVGGTTALPSCEDYAVTADCIPSDSPSHSVGGLRFGPDGKLYATLGDGANFDFVDDLALRAQNIDSLAGKLLRINTDGTAPSDNPFFDGDPTSNRSKVYAYGLRNAYRFTFDPVTGLPILGDVGWFTWEEINVSTPGANHGWPCREGDEKSPGYACDLTAGERTDPLYAYAHDETNGGSVTAGAFYQGLLYPSEYHGSFIFGDFAQNWIKRMDIGYSGDPDVNGGLTVDAVADFENDPSFPVEFVTGPDGDIFYVSVYTLPTFAGEVRRITYTDGNRRPRAVISADPTSGLTPLSVTFSSEGSFDPDGDLLNYFWDFGDSSTSTSANPAHTYTSDGVYNAILTVDDGLGLSDSKTVTIVAGDEAPMATIVSPANGSTYRVGETVALVGDGTDSEDGALPDSSHKWSIILHHNTHVHILQTLTGRTVEFVGPDHDDFDVYVEVQLTVTDSMGLKDMTSIDLFLEEEVPINGYQAEYFNNMDLSGDPVATASAVDIDFDWGLNPPATGVNADNFSSRFTGDFSFVDGDHTFYITGDDGIRLFLDDMLIIDGWVDQPATDYSATVSMAGGIHRVRLEHYDNTFHAVAKFRWDVAGVIEGVNPRHVVSEVSPQTPGAGSTATITSTVVNNGEEEPIVIDFEIFKDGAQVFQRYFENEIITTGEERDYSFDFVPSSDGEYRLAVGLIESGWGGLYEWTNNALTFTVGDVVPPPPPPSGEPRHVNTTASPDVVMPSETSTITTSVVNEGLGDEFVVDIEIFDSSGVQVYQQYYEDQFIPVGETRDYIFDWVAPAVEGVYRVAIGLIHDGWSGLYEWTNEAESVTVSEDTLPPSPPSDEALVFDGVDDYVDLSIWNLEEGILTAEAYFVQHDSTGTQRLLTQGEAPMWGLRLQGNGDGTSHAEFIMTADGVTDILEGGVIVEGVLTHVAAVYDQIEMRLYQDGALVASLPKTGFIDQPDEAVFIGSTSGDPSREAFNGALEDMRVWNVARSGSAISSTIGVDVDREATGLIKYWKFNEGFGQYVIDNSTAGHHGIFGSTSGIDENDPLWESGGSIEPWDDFSPEHVETVYVKDGSMYDVTTTITNTGTDPGHLVVDVEIYDELGARVRQAFYNGFTIHPGEEESLTFEFDLPDEGVYRVSVGLIHLNWTGLYEWVNEATVIDTGAEPPPPPPPGTFIFGDSLACGWVSWSYDTVADFAHTATVFDGARSVEATFTAPWGGLYLHHDGFDTAGFSDLSFALNGGPEGGQGLQLRPYDAANVELPSVFLADYIPGGTLDSGVWHDISIPLVDLDIFDTVFTGFLIQGHTGDIEPTFYFDHARFE